MKAHLPLPQAYKASLDAEYKKLKQEYKAIELEYARLAEERDRMEAQMKEKCMEVYNEVMHEQADDVLFRCLNMCLYAVSKATRCNAASGGRIYQVLVNEIIPQWEHLSGLADDNGQTECDFWLRNELRSRGWPYFTTKKEI